MSDLPLYNKGPQHFVEKHVFPKLIIGHHADHDYDPLIAGDHVEVPPIGQGPPNVNLSAYC